MVWSGKTADARDSSKGPAKNAQPATGAADWC